MLNNNNDIGKAKISNIMKMNIGLCKKAKTRYGNS